MDDQNEVRSISPAPLRSALRTASQLPTVLPIPRSTLPRLEPRLQHDNLKVSHFSILHACFLVEWIVALYEILDDCAEWLSL